MKISIIVLLFIFISCNSQVVKSNNDFNLKGKVQTVEEITKYDDFEMRTVYSLNEDDYVLSIEQHNADSLIEKKKFKYDNINLIREIEVFDSNGKLIETNAFQKNKKNQIEKTLVKSRSGKSILMHHYKDDSEFPNSGKEINNKRRNNSFVEARLRR